MFKLTLTSFAQISDSNGSYSTVNNDNINFELFIPYHIANVLNPLFFKQKFIVYYYINNLKNKLFLQIHPSEYGLIFLPNGNRYQMNFNINEPYFYLNQNINKQGKVNFYLNNLQVAPSNIENKKNTDIFLWTECSL